MNKVSETYKYKLRKRWSEKFDNRPRIREDDDPLNPALQSELRKRGFVPTRFMTDEEIQAVYGDFNLSAKKVQLENVTFLVRGEGEMSKRRRNEQMWADFEKQTAICSVCGSAFEIDTPEPGTEDKVPDKCPKCSKVNEAEEIFKPATPDELVHRKKQDVQAQLQRRAAFGSSPVQVDAITIHVGGSEESLSLIRWLRNNKKWTDRGIKKIIDRIIDRSSLAEIRFDRAMSMDEASQLVTEFLTDWASAATAPESRPIEVGDMVYLDFEEEESWGSDKDRGRVTQVDGNQVRIRFYKHGIMKMDAAKLTYNRGINAWEVSYTPEFKQAASQKKGAPEVGDQVVILVPKEDRSSDIPTESGRIESIKDGVATISYAYTFHAYGERTADQKVKVPISDISYDWIHKRWMQKGAEEHY